MSQKACFLQCNKLPNPLSHLMYPLLFQGLHATGSKPTVRWRFNQTITKVTVYRPERHTAVACRGSWSSSWWISKSMLDHCPVVYPISFQFPCRDWMHHFWMQNLPKVCEIYSSQLTKMLPMTRSLLCINTAKQYNHTNQLKHQAAALQSCGYFAFCSAYVQIYGDLLFQNLSWLHRCPLLWILKDISESGNCSLTFYIFFSVHNSCHSYTVNPTLLLKFSATRVRKS